ncbi:MAG: helix-turn-helix domain-containing protein [Candidatus Tectomicrobia bacterium]|uniref:Helix-turn-helix domain-containing protein n=1 Tax=Tectimicrobiota bacterium TaxID=2528274 RepID=A0A932CM91_UNCTE|nr:helix-turn-helix domain-containing protein [Candidatus Tectomicrobia bacterium]
MRGDVNLTQDDFATLIGVRGRAVSRWETGKSKPSRLALARLQEVKEKVEKGEHLPANFRGE